MTIPYHPLADIFPLVDGAEFLALVNDLRAHGLTRPIVMLSGAILDGRNRYRACLEAGVEPVFEEFSGRDPVAYVVSENVRRRHLTDGQRALAAARMAKLERGRPGTDKTDKSANLRISAAEAAAMMGISTRSVEAARAVLTDDALAAAVSCGRIAVSAAEKLAKESPETRAAVLADIEAGEKPAVAIRRAARSSRLDRLSEPGSRSWPDGKYGVILADPPWPWATWSEAGQSRSPENHYPTMGLDDIAALDVAGLAGPACGLFLWATAPHLVNALGVMAAWGFEYRSHWVWVKDKAGTGYWGRNNHELLLIGVKGDFPAPPQGEAPLSALTQPRGRHSEKPAVYAQMIAEIWRGVPGIELFQPGEAAPGWDAWGLEAGI